MMLDSWSDTGMTILSKGFWCIALPCTLGQGRTLADAD